MLLAPPPLVAKPGWVGCGGRFRRRFWVDAGDRPCVQLPARGIGFGEGIVMQHHDEPLAVLTAARLAPLGACAVGPSCTYPPLVFRRMRPPPQHPRTGLASALPFVLLQTCFCNRFRFLPDREARPGTKAGWRSVRFARQWLPDAGHRILDTPQRCRDQLSGIYKTRSECLIFQFQ